MTRSLRTALLPLTVFALVCLALAGPALARRGGRPGAAGPPEPTDAEIAVQQLRHQIAAEELVVALALTDDQADRLAEVVASTVAEREAAHAERAAHAPDLQKLLERYLADVRASGAPSPATVEALRAFHEANRPDRGEIREAHARVRAAIEEILDEAQFEALAEFRPLAAVRPERGGPEGQDREDRGEEHRERRHARHVARDVMFTPEFLDALAR